MDRPSDRSAVHRYFPKPVGWTPMNRPATIGELRAGGYPDRTVKEELRANLLARLGLGEQLFPSIVGFDASVLPALERGILAGHDLILLGERGQAKTRLIRNVVGLLDDEAPAIAGCEVNDHPYRPICARCRAIVMSEGDAVPLSWIGRDQRYAEKLATPDTSVADLIGDVDPIRVAEGRYLADELTIHYGLIPRTNRGIVAINELPDLPERIQVALFNILEERDVQIRGYRIRLPLDLLLVVTANPEDYTHRGRIVSPLKDRFGTQVRTHYPETLGDEIAIMDQEARPPPEGVPRLLDLPAVLAGSLGRVEFDAIEEGREQEILQRAAKNAILEVFRRRLAGFDFQSILGRFDDEFAAETSDLMPATHFLGQFGDLPGLGRLLGRLGVEEESPGVAASALELALEGLHLSRRLNKDSAGRSGAYRYEGLGRGK